MMNRTIIARSELQEHQLSTYQKSSFQTVHEHEKEKEQDSAFCYLKQQQKKRF